MRGKVVRLNVDDPATMERLLRNGAIWQTPMYWEKAIRFIESGQIALAECKNVPAQVMAGLRK
jgi:hypothetical protein